MITADDLNAAIAECEGQRNPTANTCLKLAAFYTIKDKMFAEDPGGEPVRYSYSAPATMPYISDTDFGQVIKDMDVDRVMPVIDELMTALAVLNPRLYHGVMRKLEN